MWSKIKAWLTTHSDFMSSVTFLAAMAHVGWAFIIMLTPQFLFGVDVKLALWVSIALTAFAACKEYIYDANIEQPKQTFIMNTQDFCGYLGGIALGWIIIAVRLHLHP
jgi:hypothetical protein